MRLDWADMRIKTTYLLALLPLFAARAAPAQVPGDTVRVGLEEVVLRALEVSPDIDAARAGRAFAEARGSLARSSRLLTEFTATSALSVSPGIKNPNGVADNALYLDPEVRNDFANLSPFTQTEIEIIQPIYTWGRLGGGVQAAAHGVGVEDGALRGVELEVALRAADLYYRMLLTNELYRLADRAGESVSRAMEEIDRLLEEGDPDVDDADRYQVLITEQEFKRRALEVAENKQMAQVALRRQLLLPEGAYLAPVDDVLRPLPFAPDPLETYFEAARTHRPELHQARSGLAAREALVRVARADYYPQLVFGLSAGVSVAANRRRQPNPYISDSFRRSSARTGFGFRQKLNFSQTRARVAQAQAEREQVRHQLRGAEQLVLFDVEKAYREMLIAFGALSAQDSSLALSKEWLRVEYINFDLDLGDTENLIKAVQANLDLEARYHDAVRRYNVAVLRLLRAAGLLVQSAQTGLLVE